MQILKDVKRTLCDVKSVCNVCNVISSDHSAVAYLIAFEDLLFQNSLVVLCSPRFTPLYYVQFYLCFP